jgi:tetratricopeptide (TPR) repeat protein
MTTPLKLSLVIFALPFFSSAQDNHADSLKNLLKTAEDTTRVILLIDLATRLTPEEATAYLVEAATVAREIGYKKGEAEAYYTQGLFNAHSSYGLAISLYRKALDVITPPDDDTEEQFVRVSNSLGVVYWLNGSYVNALEIFLNALVKSEQLVNQSHTRNILLNIGLVYEQQGDYLKAIEYFQKTYDHAVKTNHQRLIALSSNNLGNAYVSLGQADKAIAFLNTAVDIGQQRGDTFRLSSVWIDRANANRSLKRYDEALADLAKAEKIKNAVNDNRGLILANDVRAQILIAQNDFQGAEKILEKSLQLLNNLEGQKNNSLVYERFFDLFTAKQDYKKALYWHLKKTRSDDSVFNEVKSRQLAELQTLYDVNKKENEIIKLEKEKQEARLQRNIMVITIGSLAALAVLVISFMRFRIAKKNQLLAIERSLHMEKMANASLLEEELRKEIDYKNKELASYTINFVQKSELMEELKKNLQSLQPDNLEMAKKITGMSKLVENNYQVDREWEDFRMQFENVHKDFFKTLKDRFPDLSNSDLKLCALLKLNMSMKDAAKIRGISTESMKTARYRLRKKFGLRQEDNLVDFILNIDSEVQYEKGGYN